MNTYGTIGNKIAGWYARRLLEHAIPVIVLEKFAKVKQLPRNATKVIEFRRSVPFADATTPLQEGITPDGAQFSYEDVGVEMRQYGDWSTITDQIDDFSKDDVLGDIAQMQGEQIASTRESLTWDIVRSGTMKRYAGGVAGRINVDDTSLFTASEARRIVVDLQRQKARKITRILGAGSGYETYPTEAAYIAVTHTDLGPELRDIHSDVAGSVQVNHLVQVSAYGTGNAISENELGRFEDIRYVTSPDLDPFYGAGEVGAGNANVRKSGTGSTAAVDVYPTVVFGNNSFGCVVLRGKGSVMPVVMNPNVPRGGDPLGQRGWAGWKMYFACLILNEAWIMRVESAAAA